MLSYSSVHLIALKEAHKKHREIGTDFKKQIDIFGIIEKCEVPLNFQPLKQLSGAFIPAVPKSNAVAGILINEHHPRSRQRFTAAHELCHYIRDNILSLDFETEVIARDRLDKYQDNERIAEAFAAWFLMPPALIEHQSKLINLDFFRLNPTDVYQLALRLGTSYSATVNHLYTLKKIKWNARNTLLKYRPKEIKKTIVSNNDSLSWNDIWLINEKENKKVLVLQIGDQIKLILNEIPSSGYLWQLIKSNEPAIEVVENFFEDPTSNMAILGSKGQRNLIFNVNEEGIFKIALACKRPWNNEQSQDDLFKFTAHVESKRHGINLDAYIN